MKRKWFIIAVLFPALSCAQESSSGSSLNLIASSGVIMGQSTAKPLFQFTGGVQYKRFFTGLGVGLDYYNLKSIPLFVDYRMSFGKNNVSFLYADVGYNFPFGNKSIDAGYNQQIYHYYGGVYLDAGLGYRLRLNARHCVLVSAGYNRKDIFRNLEIKWPGVSPPMEQKYNYHYSFGRIAAKLSWEFGK